MFPTFLLIAGLICGALAEDDTFRLPPIYIVNHQDIDLVVPAEAFSANYSNYSGSVDINFQVTVETDEIKLHSSYEYIELLTIYLDSDAIEEGSYSGNSTTDILTLSLSENLTVGVNYTLSITFNARLLGGGGFYKVSYEDEDGETKYTATTQFQATNARNAFPCFDEPVYKSTFAFNLTYPEELSAWANTPEIYNLTLEDGYVKTIFDVSPRMSVYLVAFTIANYTCTEGDLNDDFKHRVCSRRDMEDERSLALNVTATVIEHLSTYTGWNYTDSLSKLDQMAVPGKSGAMENWGLVIYGESSLLFDSEVQTSASRQSISAIISHELAHMWFGNLLTCKWWSETFLNEGFARLFQYYTTNYVFPEMEMEKQFVVRILQSILVTEGNLDVPALRSNASTQSEVSAKFGSYTYNKGGSVLRMFEHIMGRETFKYGIQQYIQANAYQSVEPQDLLDALESVLENEAPQLPIGVNITTVADNWINKGGYPVLNVTLNGTDIIITQQRFLFTQTEDENSTWYVPVSYTISTSNDFNENTSPKGWVTPDDDLVISDFSEDSDAWIVVNNQETGFYRVNYDETLWSRVTNALKQTNFSGIHVVNRAQIVDDSYMLARAGFLTFGEVLKIVEFLEDEVEYIPWYPATSLFWYLLQRTGSTTVLGKALTDHFLALMANVSSTVPLEEVDPDSHLYTLKQVLISTYSCKFGDATCNAAAKEHFATYKSTGVRPNINIRSIVYCNSIRFSDDPASDWEFLYQQYQNSSVSTDSSIIWTALGCATNTTVLRSFLSKVLQSDGVLEATSYTSIFSTIYAANEVGVDTVLDYIIDNLQSIFDVFNANNLNLGTVLTGLASYITQEAQIAKLEELLGSESLNAILTSSVESALTTAKANQAIIETHKTSLYEYLQISDTETTVTSTTESSVTTTTTPVTTTASVATTVTSAVTTAASADTTTTTTIAETTEAVETTTSAASLGGVSMVALVVLMLVRYIDI